MFYSYLSTFLCFFFFFNDTATTEIYTLSLHDALPISLCLHGLADLPEHVQVPRGGDAGVPDVLVGEHAAGARERRGGQPLPGVAAGNDRPGREVQRAAGLRRARGIHPRARRADVEVGARHFSDEAGPGGVAELGPLFPGAGSRSLVPHHGAGPPSIDRRRG